MFCFFFFSSRRRHTRWPRDWSSDVCSSDLAALTERGAAALDGLGLADSLAIDPHKWLFQPYEIGAVLVREPGLLERVFALDGDYLRDTHGGAVNFRDRGPELTRGARGL